MSEKTENNNNQETQDEQINILENPKKERTPAEDIQLAKDILRGVHSQTENLEKLYKKLKNYNKFGLARKILYIFKKKNTDPKKRLKIYQQEALCTFKDPDLPSEVKFDKALAILNEIEDIENTKNTETLGLLGSIFKRKWQFDNKFYNLKKSKFYYARGYDIWIDQIENNKEDTDQGYTGINAAFVLDLMVNVQMKEVREVGAQDDLEENLKKIREAKKIRTRILKELSKFVENTPEEKIYYWVYTTLVEASMGIGNFKEAEKYWKLALAKNPDSWELESTKTQLMQLGQIMLAVKEQEIYLETILDESPPNLAKTEKEEESPYEIFAKKLRDFLKSALKTDEENTEKILAGKVGLALSGGGFRAAFYHIGVLAKMAEFNILKHVEAISCVSGGSIIGAYYYLKLIHLFEQKEDKEIVQQDYIQIVHEIEMEFLNAVKSDTRGMLFANLIANIRMIFSKKYSRTHRLANLYERYFYKDLFNKILHQRRARGMDVDLKGHIRMQDLFIYPKEYAIGEFRPNRDNWRRKNKIPNLILNATALNTGHNWQFTASWMGEPPGNIVKEVDAKHRLRRMYYWEAPADHKDMGLSQAVAASSGVPGVFPPLTLDNLYPNIQVHLVDGGVHDNQGIVGLTEQECQVLFVSDSSGQLLADDNLSSNPMSILPRTNSVLMERVRECQYLDLKSRSKSSLIKGLMFVHLRKGLVDKPLDWIHCEDPHDASDTASAFYDKGVLTKYNIRKDVQKLLASIRTDLDSFNDAEAYALMYSGYQMTEYEHLKSTAECLPKENRTAIDVKWDFEEIRELVESSESSVWLKNILAVGQGLLFKSFYLSRWLTAFAFVMGLAVIAGIVFLFYTFRDVSIDFEYSVSQLGIAILWIIGGLILGKLVISAIKYKDTLYSAIRGLLIAITGSVVSVLVMPLLNRVYLSKGNRKAIKKKKKK